MRAPSEGNERGQQQRVMHGDILRGKTMKAASEGNAQRRLKRVMHEDICRWFDTTFSSQCSSTATKSNRKGVPLLVQKYRLFDKARKKFSHL